jgi:hypothetical protein
MYCLVRASGLFDADWYLQQNPDVAKAGMNTLVHCPHYGIASQAPRPAPD